MARDLAALSGEAVRTLSAREFTFHNAAVVSRQYEHRRLSTLRGAGGGGVPPAGLYGGVHSPAHHSQNPADPGGPGSADGRAARPGGAGRHPGRRGLHPLRAGGGAWASSPCGGASWTCTPPAQDHPVRIEFWDTDVDSMGLFDVGSSGGWPGLDRAVFLPVSEALPTRRKTAVHAPPTGCSRPVAPPHHRGPPPCPRGGG